MTAQKGQDLLLKVYNNATSTFETAAGMRSRRIAFNADSVDITDFESAGRWRELLAGSGVQRASISGSGIFKDADSDAVIRTLFFNGLVDRWEVTIPDFGTLTAPFQITALEYGANHDGEITFELSLESAGELTFVDA